MSPSDHAPEHAQSHEGDFDVVVLGAGSGGYTAAVRCAQLGLRTAIVEEGEWGGVCLNRGCIPSKSLLRNAEIANLLASDADKFGVLTDHPIRLDYSAAFRRSRDVVDGRVRGVRYLMRKNQITEYAGHGEFLSDTTLAVTSSTGRSTLTFAHAIVAVGATTRLLPDTSISPRVMTYAEQIVDPTLPESVVIIGGGAIGVEFAYLMRSFAREVTLVEASDRLVPNEDADVSRELERQFKRQGIVVHTSTAVQTLVEGDDGVEVTLRPRTEPGATASTPEVTVVRAAKAMQAIGFRPRLDGYGLHRTGVRTTQRGSIEVDEHCRTSVDHIFAIGDVTAKLMLAHVADTMGIVAAETIAGAPTEPLTQVRYAMMPRATFCHPQIASFGYTEDQARELGFDVQVARFPFSANGKAQGSGDSAGFVKILCDRTHGELLGAHLIGSDVAELLPELTLAQQWDLTVHELARNVHAHPTLSEAVKEAVHGLAGHMINM